jgi:hypothetical protein
MTFEKAAGGAIVEVVHVGVPQQRPKGRARRLAQVLLEAMAKTFGSRKEKKAVRF